MTLEPPAPPAAARLPVAGWKDPRLILGVLLVTGCMLLGSVLVSAADDTVSVWGARRDLPAGSQLASGDLERRDVLLADGDPGRYMLADREQLVGRRLGRAVGSGELLPAAALATGSAAPGVQLPITVAGSDVPEAVHVGSVVDVWATVADGADDAKEAGARRVLHDVAVAGVGRRGDALAPETNRSIVLTVPDTIDLAEVIGAFAGSRVVVTIKAAR